jgi:hypothetical protein
VAKLIQLSRPSRRVSSVMRAWWAMRSQKRRRHGGAPADLPPLPVVTLSNGSYEWSGGLVSASFDIAVDHKTWPSANLEIWFALGSPSFALLATVGSGLGSFTHPAITDSEAVLYYKARYLDGDVVGPFSEVLEIDASL